MNLLDPKLHDVIRKADVIWAVPSTNEGHECVVYGVDLLSGIVRTGSTRTANVVRVEIDFSEQAEEVEQLLAIVESIKGHYYWNGARTPGLN